MNFYFKVSKRSSKNINTEQPTEKKKKVSFVEYQEGTVMDTEVCECSDYFKEPQLKK